MFGRGEKNMNKESYFYLLWKSLWTSFTIVALVLSLIIPFVFEVLEPEEKISLFWLITIIMILLLLLIIFVRFSIIMYENRKQQCVVLHVIEPYGNFKSNDKVLALATYVDYFTENGVVSIFHLENGFERQIALGQIINIQEDKKVQILIFNIGSAFPRDELLKNNKELLERLLVKPIVKLDYLEEIKYGK